MKTPSPIDAAAAVSSVCTEITRQNTASVSFFALHKPQLIEHNARTDIIKKIKYHITSIFNTDSFELL
jgi:hypothetical protein